MDRRQRAIRESRNGTRARVARLARRLANNNSSELGPKPHFPSSPENLPPYIVSEVASYQVFVIFAKNLVVVGPGDQLGDGGEPAIGHARPRLLLTARYALLKVVEGQSSHLVGLVVALVPLSFWRPTERGKRARFSSFPIEV